LEDAINPDKKVWGCNNAARSSEVIESLLTFESSLGFNKTDLKTASLAKLAINSYYTMKVAFNNAVYEATDQDDATYGGIMSIFKRDKRIKVSHETIMHKGYRGAGGKCLPKDTKN